MSNIFEISLKWIRSKEFTYEQFNRDHTITLGMNQTINNSAAIGYFGDADRTNPEELLMSALASCHMLTFLVIASKSGYIVDSYTDRPNAILEKNEENKMVIATINLRPLIEFSGTKIPDALQLKSLHDKAHRNCFIANSIKSKVIVHTMGESHESTR